MPISHLCSPAFPSYDLGAVITFTATHLIAIRNSSFVMEYVTQVLLSANPFESCKWSILTSSISMGRHTSVRVSLPTQGFGRRRTVEYVFHQPSVVPWGEPRSIQCPRCLVLRRSKVLNAGKEGFLSYAFYVYKCLARGCGEKVTKHLSDTGRQQPTEVIPLDKKRAWLEFEV